MDEAQIICHVCEEPLASNFDFRREYQFCENCRRRYPNALLKATIDRPFEYATRLRTGELIKFSGAVIVGAFAYLTREPIFDFLTDFPFKRGLDVRIDDMVWVADEPYDS